MRNEKVDLGLSLSPSFSNDNYLLVILFFGNLSFPVSLIFVQWVTNFSFFFSFLSFEKIWVLYPGRRSDEPPLPLV